MLDVLETITPPLASSAETKHTSFAAPAAPVGIPGVEKGCYSVDMTNAEYHADKSAVSCSRLKWLLCSPAHFLHNETEPDEESTSSQDLGTAFHMMVLEPQLFNQEIVVFPGRRQGEKWDRFKTANPGKIILNQKELDKVAGMKAAVDTFPAVDLKTIISLGEAEKTIFWRDEETGILCKARIDLLYFTEAILDLKSVGDCRPDQFLRSQALKLHYDLQAAMYCAGAKAFTGKDIPFNFVTVETDAPHATWVHEANHSGEFFANGLRKYRYALRLLKYCRQMNEWPSYGNAYSALDAIPAHLKFEAPTV